MSIQTGGGNLRVDPDDAQFTHRGKSIAIKVRDFGNATIVVIGCLLVDGAWIGAANLFEMDDVNTPASVIAKYGSADGFLRQRVAGPLNDWLTTLFAADGAPMTDLELIAATLSGTVKWLPQADGTLKAAF